MESLTSTRIEPQLCRATALLSSDSNFLKKCSPCLWRLNKLPVPESADIQQFTHDFRATATAQEVKLSLIGVINRLGVKPGNFCTKCRIPYHAQAIIIVIGNCNTSPSVLLSLIWGSRCSAAIPKVGWKLQCGFSMAHFVSSFTKLRGNLFFQRSRRWNLSKNLFSRSFEWKRLAGQSFIARSRVSLRAWYVGLVTLASLKITNY